MRGRIRSIKPEVFKDEDLWDLGVETGFPILQAFEGLWCYADKEGRFEWRPRQLKTDILPYWDGDFARVLDALTTRGFIVRYAVDGREYGWVRTFRKHQVINNRESESELPPPPSGAPPSPKNTPPSPRDDDACHTRAPRDSGESKRIGKGTEGNGKGEGAGEHASATGDAALFEIRPFTAQAQLGAFVGAYETRMRTTPSLGGKQVGDFHATVVRTAKLQQRDPRELFVEALAKWLEREHTDAERRAPYACFCQAWGDLTGPPKAANANGKDTVASVRAELGQAALANDLARCAVLQRKLEAVERQLPENQPRWGNHGR